MARSNSKRKSKKTASQIGRLKIVFQHLCYNSSPMNREYDAVFIHGQGYRNRTGRDAVPSVRGRLEMSAVKMLMESGYTFGDFVFSGIVMLGQNLSLAEVDARALERRARVDRSQIIVDESARTTSMEVGFSARLARNRNWRKVLHLTYGDVHKQEVLSHVKRDFDKETEVDVFTADQVLTTPGEELSAQSKRNVERYKRYIAAIQNTEIEKNMRKYEKKKGIILRIPFGYKFLELASLIYRPDPTNKKTN